MHIQSYLMKYTYNGFCADSGSREMTSRRASTGVLHTRPPANALLDPSQLAAFVVLHLLATVTMAVFQGPRAVSHARMLSYCGVVVATQPWALPNAIPSAVPVRYQWDTQCDTQCDTPFQ